MKWHFISQPAGVMCPAIARVAFCTYLLRFTGTGKKIKRFLWFIVITQLLVNILTMVEILISCKKFEMLWNADVKPECWSPKVQAYMGYFQGACNSLTDLILTFLPWFMLKDLQMEFQTKLALSVLMGFSIFAMIACIVKSIELKVLGNRNDFTYNSSRFIIWLTVENYVVITAASIPTLRPLALRFCKWRAARRMNVAGLNCSSKEDSDPPAYDSAYSWTSRPNPVRLHSTRQIEHAGRWELEPPYIHPKQRKPPPPGTIRKTISIRIRSESDCDDIELVNIGVGVHMHVCAGGRETHLTAQDDAWQTASTSARQRSSSMAGTEDVVDVDLERQ